MDILSIAASNGVSNSVEYRIMNTRPVFSHYAGMATYALTFVVLVAIAAVSGITHRVAVYVASLMAILLAASSVFNPTVSAIDGAWAALAILWAVTVVATFEWSARAPGAIRGGSEPNGSSDAVEPRGIRNV